MTIVVDYQVPEKIYRYSSKRWLQRAFELGEFKLTPASEYAKREHVAARRDEEINREIMFPDGSVKVYTEGGKEFKSVKNFTLHASTGTDYLTLCFSKWQRDYLYDEFSGSDSCLVVNDVAAFSNRMHAAVEQILSGWVGFDGPVSYGMRSDFGAAFLKPEAFSIQGEWRFAWHPPQPIQELACKVVRIGNLEDICELVERPREHT